MIVGDVCESNDNKMTGHVEQESPALNSGLSGLRTGTQQGTLGKGSNNQNGNLRWHLPLGV